MEVSAKEYRTKLKKKCDEKGLAALEPMEKLELVLFYCLPANSVAACAKGLISHYGSVNAVFNATFESLVEVPGMSENAATFIKLIPDMCVQYSKSASENSILLGHASIREYFKSQYYGFERELVMLACLDKHLRVIKICTIAEGTTSYAMLNSKLLVSEVIGTGCDGCILAHNHPQGNCEPSDDDITLTKGVRELLHTLNVKLFDHVIVGMDGVRSFRTDGRL